MTDGTTTDLVAGGWGELREARWRAAPERFETALAVEESPEACRTRGRPAEYR